MSFRIKRVRRKPPVALPARHGVLPGKWEKLPTSVQPGLPSQTHQGASELYADLAKFKDLQTLPSFTEVFAAIKAVKTS